MRLIERTHSDEIARPLRSPRLANEDSGLLAGGPIRLVPTIPQARLSPRCLSPHDVLRFQRTIGNQSTARMLLPSGIASEAVAGQGEPDQERKDEPPRTTAVQVSAVFRSGSSTPETRIGAYTPKPEAVPAGETVGPTGTPTVHSGGGNACTPGTEALDWNVAEDGANWRANVIALNVSGDIHITDWASAPSSMTVPNTPNPVDGGNINNRRGSLNRWRAAIDDMADYDTAGGGAGPNWHSTPASRAHEWAHWNSDYLADTIPTANWTGANRDIDRITVAKSGHADAAAARTALEPRVTARFNTFVRAATARWNVIIRNLDQPGAGGRGYAAGKAVLDGLIASVRTYATSKGWTGARRSSTRGPARPRARTAP